MTLRTQSLNWDGMGCHGMPRIQSLSHGNTVYERQKERVGNKKIIKVAATICHNNAKNEPALSTQASRPY